LGGERAALNPDALDRLRDDGVDFASIELAFEGIG
jgi:hypothetical protein